MHRLKGTPWPGKSYWLAKPGELVAQGSIPSRATLPYYATLKSYLSFPIIPPNATTGASGSEINICYQGRLTCGVSPSSHMNRGIAKRPRGLRKPGTCGVLAYLYSPRYMEPSRYRQRGEIPVVVDC